MSSLLGLVDHYFSLMCFWGDVTKPYMTEFEVSFLCDWFLSIAGSGATLKSKGKNCWVYLRHSFLINFHYKLFLPSSLYINAIVILLVVSSSKYCCWLYQNLPVFCTIFVRDKNHRWYLFLPVSVLEVRSQLCVSYKISRFQSKKWYYEHCKDWWITEDLT